MGDTSILDVPLRKVLSCHLEKVHWDATDGWTIDLGGDKTAAVGVLWLQGWVTSWRVAESVATDPNVEEWRLTLDDDGGSVVVAADMREIGDVYEFMGRVYAGLLVEPRDDGAPPSNADWLNCRRLHKLDESLRPAWTAEVNSYLTWLRK